MKLQNRLTACLLLLVALEAFPTIGSASETRVDSVGGLTTVMTDETSDLSLFLDGNPAGLILLQTRDRFDLAGQWDYSTSQPVTQASNQQTFSTIPRLPDPGTIHYGGLMAFPGTGWAFQVAGDFNNLEGQPVYSYDTYSLYQYRGMVRCAYDSGPFAFGLEVMNIELDKSYDPGLFNPYVGVQSGASGQDQTLVRAGFITTFPETRSVTDPRWQVGGVFATQVGPTVQTFNASMFYSNSPTFGLQQTVATTGYYFFGPEIYYEIPNRVILRFSSFVTNNDTDFEQDVSQVSVYFQNLSKFHSMQYSSINTTGAFRLSFPTSDKESLKLGGALTSISTNTDLLGTAQNVYDNQDKQQINSALGVGLESFRDYTLGLQFKSQNFLSGNNSIASNTSASQANTDFDLYQLAFGGEKWVSPSVAFRIGLVAEEDLYSQSVSSQLFNTFIITGVGVQTHHFTLDCKLSFGQTVDLHNSNNVSSLTSAELSGTLFL